jgi:UPF0755 protein
MARSTPERTSSVTDVDPPGGDFGVPESEQGTEPGLEQGTEPGLEQGLEPGLEQGLEPGAEQLESGVSRSSRTRPRRRFGLVALVVGVVVLAIVIGGYLWVNSEASPGGSQGQQVIVTVPAGGGTDQLASDLESKGVISSAFAYQIWSVLHSAPSVVAGDYAFDQNSSFSEVDAIVAGGPNVFDLEVPPGFTVREVAERVGQLPGHDQASFSALANSGQVRSPWEPAGVNNLDGLLGTGSYPVVPRETDRQLLTQMVDRFDALANRLDLKAGSAKLGLTPYQVITVASITEKEGVIEKNLGPVARVILNRLHRGIPLQMDSTVLYALDRDGGAVTPQDLQVRTPYNTYLNTGLTPSPICFPSVGALRAALDPPRGSWLYFDLTSEDGTETFSDTYSEQLAAEALAKQRGLP